MKKVVLALLATISLAFCASAQVMNKSGFTDTIWTGLGEPLQGKFAVYGLMNTFQTRQDVGKFTIEGMLNLGLLAYNSNLDHIDGFEFAITEKNPLQFHNGMYNKNSNDTGLGLDNSFNPTNIKMDTYYVNFLWHFAKNFDFGFGTKLNWKVGSAPGYGGWLWESSAHVRQGGFSTRYDDRRGGANSHKFNVDRPGTADVVGFVPYANTYAKTSIGVRFQSSDVLNGFEAGLALPIAQGDGFNITDNLSTNIGLKLSITEWLSVATAIEGLAESAANIYMGVTFGVDKFKVEVYSSADSLFTEADDDVAIATGAAVTFRIGKSNPLVFRPEAGVNFFQNSHYTPSWYSGILFDWNITESVSLGAWTSLAFGSKDKRWDDNKKTSDYNGGSIFDIRPIVGLKMTNNVEGSAYVDVTHRKAFDGKDRTCWSTGAYLTIKF